MRLERNSRQELINKFYQECKIIKEEDEEIKTARLYLICIVKEIIVEGWISSGRYKNV